jgi:hypothetical protein
MIERRQALSGGAGRGLYSNKKTSPVDEGKTTSAHPDGCIELLTVKEFIGQGNVRLIFSGPWTLCVLPLH